MKFSKSIFIVAVLSCFFNFLFSMEKGAIMTGKSSGQTKAPPSLEDFNKQNENVRIDDRFRTGEGSEEFNTGMDDEFIELDDANDYVELPAGPVGDM